MAVTAQHRQLRLVHNKILDAELDLQHFANNGWTPAGAYQRVQRLRSLRRERRQLARQLGRGAA